MKLRLWGVMLALLFLSSLVHAAPIPKGARTLGLSVGQAKDGDYGRAFAAAQAGGIQSVTLPLDWSRLETAPGKYDNTLLSIAEGFYPPRHVAVDLVLRPINTSRSEVPADLRGKPFDDPLVIARFEGLLDNIFAHLPHLALHSLAIGNEVDSYLSQDTSRWQHYTKFYSAVRAYAHKKRPSLKVGVAATFDGLTGPSQKPLQALNTDSDFIMATYYPLHPDFTIRSSTVVGPDFARLCALYPSRPVVFLEAGYPSSPDCGSSPQLQAEFVRSLFAAWDAHAAQIVSVTFNWQTDISPEATANFGHYYGVSSKPFAAFLGSLGLQTYEGQDKPAWNTWKEEAKARGW